MKVTTIATLLGTIIGSATLSSVANAQDLPELDRQLTIMSSVIQTALKQDTRKEKVRLNGIESTYLAKQGVVFTIRTGGAGRIFDFDFGEFLGNIPGVTQAPQAPHPPSVTVVTDDMHADSEHEYEVVFDSVDWEGTANQVIRRVEHIIREADDRLREFRSDHREVEWEMRELERRNHDLEFELRTADKERQKEVEKEMKELNKELERLQAKEQLLAKESKALAAEKQAELEKQKQAQEASYKSFLSNFEASIGDTLCSFGAGLRELPDNEHITFVLDGFARNEEGKPADRVYIFSKKDVKRCVTDDISVDDMLASAKVYTF